MNKVSYRQAKWNEPSIFEKSTKGRIGHIPPSVDQKESNAIGNPDDSIPRELKRKQPPSLPELSEVEVVRHYIRLSQENFGVDSGISQEDRRKH